MLKTLPWRFRRCRRGSRPARVASIGRKTTFWFGDARELAERLDILLGDEVVDGLAIAAGEGFGQHGGRFRLGLGLAFACLGVAKRTLLSAFGLENGRLLLALGRSEMAACRKTLGFQNVGALVALRLHLARHAFDEIGGGGDVLDLDARDLDAPGPRRLVDHGQELGVDAVALGQELVQIHRAHHRADIGHGQVDDRPLEIGHLIGGARGFLHLVEDHAVDRHHGVVPGDDLLRRHVHHLLHHVDAARRCGR